jgi:hypothetical protein
MLMVLLGIIFVAMLYFGIWFKGFRLTNNAKWTESGTGIAFNRFGLA